MPCRNAEVNDTASNCNLKFFNDRGYSLSQHAGNENVDVTMKLTVGRSDYQVRTEKLRSN
eukprot:scaffold396699_cov18-Prasinocladus_malaysianus.AAC.1